MSDHFEPKLYVAVGRAGGKVYESQRLMYDLLVNGYELKPMNVKKENNMNDIEFTNLHVKNILNGVIGAKPPKQPVMSKRIRHVNIQEPEIVLKSSWDGDDVNGVMATFRKDIYAKVVDTTDKAIVDAIIDFARSEGFTDAYLIDEKFIRDAIVTKNARDAEVEHLNMKIEDAEERNNVKDAEIDNLRVEIDGLRNTVNAKDALIRKLTADLDEYKDCIGDDPRAVKEEFMELNKECCDLHNVEANLRETIKIRDSQIDGLRANIRNQAEMINKNCVEISKLYDDIHEIAEERDSVIKKNATLVERIGELEKKIREAEVTGYLKGDALRVAIMAEKQALKQRNEELKDENLKLIETMKKYKIVIYTIEQMLNCKFDI